MKDVKIHTIKTERLVLREFQPEDVEAVCENYEVEHVEGDMIDFAESDDKEKAKKVIEEGMETNSTYGFAIVLDGIVIGSVGMFHIDRENEQCEIGYNLGEKWAGKGYATEAVKAVVEFGLQEVRFRRIYAYHAVENLASERVLQKSGFAYEGTGKDTQMNPDGTCANLKLYAIENTR